MNATAPFLAASGRSRLVIVECVIIKRRDWCSRSFPNNGCAKLVDLANAQAPLGGDYFLSREAKVEFRFVNIDEELTNPAPRGIGFSTILTTCAYQKTPEGA